MSDTGVSALVTIEPDFTGFEEKLTRALKDAVEKAQKSATVSLNVQGTGGAANAEMKAFNASLTEVNKSLKEIAANTKRTSDEVQKSFVGSLTNAIQKTAVFASAISQVVGNITNIVNFGLAMKDAAGAFKAGSDQADGFKAKMFLLGRSLRDALVDEEEQTRTVKKMGETIVKTEKVANKAKETIKGFGKSSKQAATETKAATEDMKKGFADIGGDEAGFINTGQILSDLANLPKRIGSIFRKTAPEAEAAAEVINVKFREKLATGDPGSSGFFTKLREGFRRQPPVAIEAAEEVKQGFLRRILSAIPGLDGFFNKVKNGFAGLKTTASGVGTIGQALAGLGKTAFNASVGASKLGLNISSLGKSAVQSFAGMSNFGKAMTVGAGAALALGAAVGVALIGKLAQLTQRGIQAAAEMERLQIALKGVFQFTKEQAADAFKQINEFAAKTPFSLQASTNAIIKLKASFKNLDLTGAQAILKDLASAAAAGGATEEALQRASLAITQIGSKGRLSAEEMNQFTEALPNVSRTAVFEILAKRMNKTTEEIIRLQEAGKISGTEGINALLQAAREAPGAGTALEDQAQSFQGALSTVKDLFQQLLATSFTPLLQQITKIFSTMQGSFDKITPVMNKFGQLLSSVFQTLAPVIQDLVVQGAAFAGVLVPIVGIGVQLIAVFLQPFTKITTVLVGILAALLIPVLIKVSQGIAFLSEWMAKIIKFVQILAEKQLKSLISALAGTVGFLNRVRSAIASVAKAIGGALSPIIDFVVERFKDFQVGIQKVLKFASKLPGVGTTMKNIASAAKEAFGSGSGFEKLDLPAGKVDDLKEKVIDLEREMADLINTTEGFPRVLGAIGAQAFSAFQAGGDQLKKFKNTLIQAVDLVFEPLDPFKGAADAAKAAADARKNLAGIDAQINDLAGQRNALIQKRRDLEGDTARKIREQEDSLNAIADIERSIRDLQQEREELVFQEQRRQEDFAPTLAALEDQTLTANINLARAKRDVEAAQKAINDAVEAGIPKEQFNLDLAGLSLDQIRVKLAQTRATLAAQKQGLKADEQSGEQTKSKEELQEDLLLAQIGVRDAEREIVDLGQSRVDLIREADIAQREFGERLIDLGVREGQLNRQKSDALAEHQRLLRGEIGIQAEIKQLSQEIAGINRQIADTSAQRAAASLQVRDAELAAAEAAARARGDAAALLQIKQQQVNLQLEGARLDDATTAALREQLRLTQERAGSIGEISRGLQGLQTGQLVTNPTTGIISVAPGTSDPLGLLQQAADALINAIPGLREGQRVIDQLNQDFRNGFGLADGAIVNSPIRTWVGEAGREAVLPLTRPGRMQSLLSDSSVWAPILKAMPNQAKASVLPQLSASSLSIAPQARSAPSLRSGPATATISRQEKKNEMRMLADLIAEALKEAGALDPRTVEVHAPTTIQTPANPQINERAIVRKVLAALEGKL